MHMNRLLTLSLAALFTATACAPSAPDAAAADKSADKKETMPSSDKKPDDGPKPGDLPAPDDVAAAPADAQKTASGLAYKVLSKGTGTDSPLATDRVQVHYTGWQTNGKMFDSSVKRGTPATFPLNGVIKGWTEGVQLMKEGDKFRFWIPADMAYGDPPKRPGAPAGMLVFDIELLSIDKPIPAPADVAAAPSDAKKTASGLAYKVLTPGTGKVKPTAEDTVEVHYTGWETNGRMFDSSVKRGQTTSFPLNRVIKGWTEGVQLMVVGEKTRFWIPADLAYGEQAQGGRPSGLLVFDIELVSIQGK
jgi:FKBP-type peptidyl-prolyl cis-trans isomerase